MRFFPALSFRQLRDLHVALHLMQERCPESYRTADDTPGLLLCCCLFAVILDFLPVHPLAIKLELRRLGGYKQNLVQDVCGKMETQLKLWSLGVEASYSDICRRHIPYAIQQSTVFLEQEASHGLGLSGPCYEGKALTLGLMSRYMAVPSRNDGSEALSFF